MKRILLPTDFSKCAMQGVLTGVKLAKRLQAKVYFYHNRMPNETVSAIQMQELLNNLDLEGISVSCIEKEGKAINNICDFISEAKIDMVVMGTHGTSGLNEWATGSFAQKIVRSSPCPVLIVKNEIPSVDFQNIVFLSNFDLKALPAFEWTTEFANTFNSKIHMLNIDTPNYFTEIPFLIKEAMDDFAATYSGPIEKHRVRSWNVEGGLKKFLKSLDADIVVVPTNGLNRWQSLFFTSIAEEIANHLAHPILTMKI